MLWSSSPTAVNRPRGARRVLDQRLQQLVLHGVGVLHLVDQHVVELRLPLGARLGVALQQLQRQADQVVEVHRLEGRQALLVDAASRARRPARRRLAATAAAPAESSPWFFHRLMAHCQRRASALSLQPPASRSTPSTSSLSRIENFCFSPTCVAVAAQHAHAQRVEGADRQVLGRARADQRLGTLAHLGRGLVGEGDGGDLLRLDAACSSRAILCTMTRVLPEPAPASTRQGRRRWCTACICASFRETGASAIGTGCGAAHDSGRLKTTTAQTSNKVPSVTGMPITACCFQSMWIPLLRARSTTIRLAIEPTSSRLPAKVLTRASITPADVALQVRQQQHHRRHVGHQVGQQPRRPPAAARVRPGARPARPARPRRSAASPVLSKAWLTTNRPMNSSSSCQSTKPITCAECKRRLSSSTPGADQRGHVARPVGEQEDQQQHRGHAQALGGLQGVEGRLVVGLRRPAHRRSGRAPRASPAPRPATATAAAGSAATGGRAWRR